MPRPIIAGRNRRAQAVCCILSISAQVGRSLGRTGNVLDRDGLPARHLSPSQKALATDRRQIQESLLRADWPVCRSVMANARPRSGDHRAQPSPPQCRERRRSSSGRLDHACIRATSQDSPSRSGLKALGDRDEWTWLSMAAAPTGPGAAAGAHDVGESDCVEAEQRQRERQEREAAEVRKAQEAERAVYYAKHGWPA